MVDMSLRELWLAVLTRAILDLHAHDLCADRQYSGYFQASARGWFESQSHEPGSFFWVAELLSLDPSATRKAIFACANLDSILLTNEVPPRRSADICPAAAGPGDAATARV